MEKGLQLVLITKSQFPHETLWCPHPYINQVVEIQGQKFHVKGNVAPLAHLEVVIKSLHI